MIERINASALSQPPGYSHVVLASGSRLVSTAGAVPLDAEGNLVGAGDLRDSEPNPGFLRPRSAPCGLLKPTPRSFRFESYAVGQKPLSNGGMLLHMCA